MKPQQKNIRLLIIWSSDVTRTWMARSCTDCKSYPKIKAWLEYKLCHGEVTHSTRLGLHLNYEHGVKVKTPMDRVYTPLLTWRHLGSAPASPWTWQTSGTDNRQMDSMRSKPNYLKCYENIQKDKFQQVRTHSALSASLHGALYSRVKAVIQPRHVWCFLFAQLSD